MGGREAPHSTLYPHNANLHNVCEITAIRSSASDETESVLSVVDVSVCRLSLSSVGEQKWRVDSVIDAMKMCSAKLFIDSVLSTTTTTTTVRLVLF